MKGFSAQTGQIISSLEQIINCAICLEPFTNPVLVSCGHTFCRECITNAFRKTVRARCPMCQKVISKRSLLESGDLPATVQHIVNLVTCFHNLNAKGCSNDGVDIKSKRRSKAIASPRRKKPRTCADNKQEVDIRTEINLDGPKYILHNAQDLPLDAVTQQCMQSAAACPSTKEADAVVTNSVLTASGSSGNDLVTQPYTGPEVHQNHGTASVVRTVGVSLTETSTSANERLKSCQSPKPLCNVVSDSDSYTIDGFSTSGSSDRLNAVLPAVSTDPRGNECTKSTPRGSRKSYAPVCECPSKKSCQSHLVPVYNKTPTIIQPVITISSVTSTYLKPLNTVSHSTTSTSSSTTTTTAPTPVISKTDNRMPASDSVAQTLHDTALVVKQAEVSKMVDKTVTPSDTSCNNLVKDNDNGTGSSSRAVDDDVEKTSPLRFTVADNSSNSLKTNDSDDDEILPLAVRLGLKQRRSRKQRSFQHRLSSLPDAAVNDYLTLPTNNTISPLSSEDKSVITGINVNDGNVNTGEADRKSDLVEAVNDSADSSIPLDRHKSRKTITKKGTVNVIESESICDLVVPLEDRTNSAHTSLQHKPDKNHFGSLISEGIVNADESESIPDLVVKSKSMTSNDPKPGESNLQSLLSEGIVNADEESESMDIDIDAMFRTLLDEKEQVPSPRNCPVSKPPTSSNNSPNFEPFSEDIPLGLLRRQSPLGVLSSSNKSLTSPSKTPAGAGGESNDNNRMKNDTEIFSTQGLTEIEQELERARERVRVLEIKVNEYRSNKEAQSNRTTRDPITSTPLSTHKPSSTKPYRIQTMKPNEDFGTRQTDISSDLSRINSEEMENIFLKLQKNQTEDCSLSSSELIAEDGDQTIVNNNTCNSSWKPANQMINTDPNTSSHSLSDSQLLRAKICSNGPIVGEITNQPSSFKPIQNNLLVSHIEQLPFPDENHIKSNDIVGIRDDNSACRAANSSNEKFTRSSQISFIVTGLRLHSQQNQTDEFVSKFGVHFSSKFQTGTTTHIVVHTDPKTPKVCDRTLKYLLGIASKCWVVCHNWIVDSIAAEEILNEEAYEIEQDTCVVQNTVNFGPKRSRTSKSAGLLKDFEVCFRRSFKDLTRADLQLLLELSGGRAVDDPKEFSRHSVRTQLIVVQPSANEDVTPSYCQDLYKTFYAMVVSREWLLDSISLYMALPVQRFLLCKV